MQISTFHKWRILIGALVAVLVTTAVTMNNLYLAITGVLVGVLLLSLARKRYKEVLVDERIISISGMASRMAYVIVTVFLAVVGMFFILSGRGDGNIYVESTGILLCYVSMLLLAVYSVSYYYFNNKYGGNE